MLENVDRRDGKVYVFARGGDDPLRLAISVALATERPLLLGVIRESASRLSRRSQPGTGTGATTNMRSRLGPR